ncbi:MAG: NPXTG-anchored protein [Clostridia bacterium]|nr:NPXTG-anchored protein [Clostridia bacterium]
MKLAKKVLVFVVALALMSTVAATAFAAGASLSISAPATAKVGDTIEVSVTLNGAKGLTSGVFLITWDKAVLDYQGQKNAVLGEEGSAIGGEAEGGATVAINYYEAATVDSLTLTTVTFKVIGDIGDKGALNVAVFDNDIDGVDEPAAAAGSVTIVGEEPVVTDAPQPSDEPAEPTTSNDEPTKPAATTKPGTSVPKTGDAGVAVAAALVVLAGAAFVASKKTK